MGHKPRKLRKLTKKELVGFAALELLRHEAREAGIYRPPADEPCNQCPFRRKAVAGWLGASSPERFIGSILSEMPMPCHPTINYEDPNWAMEWAAQKTGRACAGALIFAANIAKRPRDSRAPQLKANHEAVFSTPKEFIEHHRNAPVRSWEGHDDEVIPTCFNCGQPATDDDFCSGCKNYVCDRCGVNPGVMGHGHPRELHLEEYDEESE